MPLDIETLKCPQCESIDISITAPGCAVCNSCGAQILFHVSSDAQAAEIEADGEELPDEIISERIPAQYSVRSFLRKMLSELEEEDTPTDIFDGTIRFECCEAYPVAYQKIVTTLSYTAQIGYDREETEGGTQHTVTDWSSYSDTKEFCVCMANRLDGKEFDKVGFRLALHKYEQNGGEFVLGERRSAEEVRSACRESIAQALFRQISDVLPGDRQKDPEFHFETYAEEESCVYIVPEYVARIDYHGKTYYRRTYPFGAMKIRGDPLPRGEIVQEEDPWNRLRVFGYLTLAALALSSVVSLLSPHPLPIIACFLAGIGVFCAYQKKASKTENELILEAQERKRRGKKQKWNELKLDGDDI